MLLMAVRMVSSETKLPLRNVSYGLLTSVFTLPQQLNRYPHPSVSVYLMRRTGPQGRVTQDQ